MKSWIVANLLVLANVGFLACRYYFFGEPANWKEMAIHHGILTIAVLFLMGFILIGGKDPDDRR